MATMYMLLLLVGLITSSCTTTTSSTTSSAFGAPLLVPSTNTAPVCKETERIALVEFKKQIIKDPSNKLISSWEGQDCCSWEGVRCDNRTGNIVGLDLYDFYLKGDVSQSDQYQWLSHLTSLQHFVANGVNFSYSSSSLFLALNKLPSIKEIRLSGCGLETIPDLSIPDHLNFSSLAILDLSGNQINFSGCSWVFNLKTLEYLDLSNNWLYPSSSRSSPETSYPHVILTNGGDGVPGEISIPESMGSLCSLQTLDLSMLEIMNKRLDELGAVFSGCMKNSLTHLYLSSASLQGDIPDWIWDMKNLKVLDLSGNSLSGSLPSSITTLSSLEKLLLSSNKYIGGTLPEEIGELAELINLDLSGNQLTGVVSEAHFVELKKLERLGMSDNSLVFKVSSNWLPPFLLDELSIRNCSVGPGFPTWLRTQHKLNSLDMSYTGITGTIPDWFWNLTKNVGYLRLSNNQIEGMLPKYLNFTSSLHQLDLSSNWFYGPLPEINGSEISVINLSNNLFSGPILPSIVEDKFHEGYYSDLSIFLSMNQLNGSTPSWLCQKEGLIDIDISENHLSGELPDCWSSSSTLVNINLAYNNIIGSMPHSICHNPRIQSLQLSHNKFSGEFPLSLKNCSKLGALDLSYNNFTGSIPVWVRENLPRITILKLKANSFAGHIPYEISQLKYLHVLDLSDNNFSGLIPKSMGNFTSMLLPPEAVFWEPVVLVGGEAMSLSFKGREDVYIINHLPFVKLIDLSNNDLSGLIPEELANLYGLLSLNLSGNQLEGEIPNELGRLKHLESLDLSRNKLSGSIPSTLSNLTFLNHFNLSHNNLSERIPSGNQFSTFNDPSIYIGNHLCGPPLNEKCTKDGGASKKEPSDHQEDEDNEDNEMIWLYIGSISGFAVGFWTVWGILALKKKWRHDYFRFTDNIFNNIYVYVVVNFKRMKNKITSNY